MAVSRPRLSVRVLTLIALALVPGGALATSSPVESPGIAADVEPTLAQRAPRRRSRSQREDPPPDETRDEERRSDDDGEKKSSSSKASSKKSSKKSSKRSAKKRKKRKKKAKASSGAVAVPIDIGLGPQLLVPNPPLFFEQPVYTALNISIAAVINKELIEANKDRIPKQYRDAASNLGEVRIRPWWLLLIPSTIVISPDVIPGVTTTGMYGATWRPFGLGVDLLSEPVRFNVHADIALTYLFLHSQLREPTHFLRPGLTLSAVLEVPVTETFLISLGWASDLYIPQPLSQPPWTLLPLEDSLWHLGGPFLKLHVRIPYEVSL